MAKDPDAGTMSEESISYLEEVKKGKPRKFAMICKGTSVVSLVIYKKGNVEKRKKEAKETGRGQFYFGVVDGKGVNIRFALSRSDGFESPPVKTASLKDFLDETADFKCKPVFEIVDATPPVLDEDDPLVARFLKLQETALAAGTDHPDRAAEINALCRQIGGHLDQEQLDDAATQVDILERLLGGLAGAITSQPVPTAPPNDDLAKANKLLEALKKFKPMLEKAIELHPQRKAELIGSVAKARDELKNNQLPQAQVDIVALGHLLKSLVVTAPSSTTAPSSPASAPDSAEVTKRLSAISGAIKEALLGANAGRIKPLVVAVKGFAAAKDYSQAIKVLDELESLLKPQSSAAPDKDNAFVSFTQSRLQWDSARKLVASELGRLEQSILTTFQAQPAIPKDKLAVLEMGTKKLYTILEKLDGRLIDKLDEALGSPTPESRTELHKQAAEIVREYQAFVQADALINNIDGNPFIPVNVRGHLVQTLADLSSKLS